MAQKIAFLSKCHNCCNCPTPVTYNKHKIWTNCGMQRQSFIVGDFLNHHLAIHKTVNEPPSLEKQTVKESEHVFGNYCLLWNSKTYSIFLSHIACTFHFQWCSLLIMCNWMFCVMGKYWERDWQSGIRTYLYLAFYCLSNEHLFIHPLMTRAKWDMIALPIYLKCRASTALTL